MGGYIKTESSGGSRLTRHFGRDDSAILKFSMSAKMLYENSEKRTMSATICYSNLLNFLTAAPS